MALCTALYKCSATITVADEMVIADPDRRKKGQKAKPGCDS